MPKLTLRVSSLLAALGLLAGAYVGLAGGDEPLAEMSLEPTGGGRVEVLRDGEPREVDEVTDIRPGDLIQTDTTHARLRLEGNRNIWVGSFTNVLVATGTAVEARAGSVLVDSADPTSVRVGVVEASSSGGVFRVDRRVATARAATYRGAMALTAPGEPRLEIAPLFQASIAAGDLAEPVPYQVSADDVWDEHWLQPVVALDDELDRLADSFSNQLRKTRPRLSDFRKRAGRPVPFIRPYLDRPAADLFIAYAIADHTSGRSLADAFEEVFQLRDDRGSWGVIATIMGVEGGPLVSAVERVFLGFVASKPVKGRALAGPRDKSPSSPGRARRGDASPPASSPQEGPSDRPEEPKEPKKPNDPPEECKDEIDCVFQELPLPDSPPDECKGEVECALRHVMKPSFMPLVS